MKLDEDLRVLTVHEPWASCIEEGRKRWENRPERVAQFARNHLAGRWLAIHAGKGWAAEEKLAPDGRPWPHLRRHGIVALAKVGRVEANGDGPTDPWRAPGEWGIELTQVLKLRVVPCTGGQGWRVLRRNAPEAWENIAAQVERLVEP